MAFLMLTSGCLATPTPPTDSGEVVAISELEDGRKKSLRKDNRVHCDTGLENAQRHGGWAQMSQGCQQVGERGGGQVGLAQAGLLSEGEDAGVAEGRPWSGTGLDRRGRCGSAAPVPGPLCLDVSAAPLPSTCQASRLAGSPSGVALSPRLFPGLSLVLSPSPTLSYWPSLGGPQNTDSVPLCLTSG